MAPVVPRPIRCNKRTFSLKITDAKCATFTQAIPENAPVDHMVQPTRPLGRIPPQQPIPTTQIPHRRLPSQRPQQLARAPIHQILQGRRQRRRPQIMMSQQLTPLAPLAAVLTNSQRSGRYWLNTPSTILPAGNALAARWPGTEPVAPRATQSTLGAPTRLISPAPTEPSIARCPPANANAGTTHEPSRSVQPEAAPQQPSYNLHIRRPIVRPRITRGSIISGPALFNYVG